MKFRALVPVVLSLLPCGCGFVGKTLNTVTNTAGAVVNTVTAPVRGVLNVADEGSEKAWSEKAAAGYDRSRTQKQRRR